MACALGLPELASHNPFIKELDELGYHVDFVGGYFVIYGLPYLDQEGGLKHGDWVSPARLKRRRDRCTEKQPPSMVARRPAARPEASVPCGWAAVQHA